MSALRRSLVALLAAATVLFVVGVIVERSAAETHTEPVPAHGGESTDTEAGEGGEADEAARSEEVEGGSKAEEEQVLGIDVESTPLIVLAALAGVQVIGGP